MEKQEIKIKLYEHNKHKGVYIVRNYGSSGGVLDCEFRTTKNAVDAIYNYMRNPDEFDSTLERLQESAKRQTVRDACYSVSVVLKKIINIDDESWTAERNEILGLEDFTARNFVEVRTCKIG